MKKEDTAKAPEGDNPFYSQWGTPFETPDFSKIKDEHFMPAFEKGIAEKKAEIHDIAENKEEPTFKNTIDALELSGALLDDVSNVFFNLFGSDNSDVRTDIATKVSPMLSSLSDDVFMNENLFKRIKTLYNNKENLDLTAEQLKVIDNYYKAFIRNGVNLPADKKERLREINSKLSTLSLKYGKNVLDETNKFQMLITDEADLEGLPESVRAAAAEAAGKEGSWKFTIHKPSLIPFLTYSAKRDLREKMFKAYITQGDHNDSLDNKKIASEIASLRVERANLLGYKTHADFVLEENMAKNPKNVMELLNKVWKPALEAAKAEVVELQKMIDAEAGKFKLEPWDWWYYAEKLRKAKYDLDEEELRPYFKLENVRQGAFDVANKLWGITFEERNDISKYNSEVTVYEVKDADGSHIGLFYTDYFPRESKRSGAWMNALRPQRNLGGEAVTPIIFNVCNFSKPVGDKPSLLTFEEVETLFHEFGHALHGLLSECHYPSVAGTSVSRDFVELPSQIMENWAAEPEVIKAYGKHYKTGESIPDELITKIKNASTFNQGFVTTELLAAALLDMYWHTLESPEPKDVTEFETNSLNDIGLINEIVVRYRSTYFKHIFSGGYSSGYYGYIWAEVLDKDAFEAFKENGLFDQATAKAFRDNILSRGGTADPMELYKAFRGKEPSIEPLLKGRGLVK